MMPQSRPVVSAGTTKRQPSPRARWMGALALFVVSAAAAAEVRPPNVLFLAVDDLRPELGCYGRKQVISPHIDRLAAQGVRFDRAYCQYPVCHASRGSLLTGRRPDTLGTDFRLSAIRQRIPDLITLPQQFKRHGYDTRSFGKIYHGSFETAYLGRTFDDPASWSRPGWFGSSQYYFTPRGIEVAREVYAKKSAKKGGGGGPDAWKSAFVQGLATEAPDVPDRTLYDGVMTDRAIAALGELKDQPFFLGVGYLKPHLPFVAPKKYWDLYERAKLAMPWPAAPPRGAPEVARHSHGELRVQYTNMRDEILSEAQVRELLHGYYACVSFIDAQIGRLLGELDRLGLRDNTIVVLWGDHGWHLGEQSLWGKMTGFELSARVPLIVCAPDRKARGAGSSALVEFVDLFPTLCELSGLPQPNGLEGTSFVPLLDAPDRPWKPAAFTQLVRGQATGRSIRTERYRFTRWTSTKAPNEIVGVELYDYAASPLETENLAGRPEHAALEQKLAAALDSARPPNLP